MQLGVVGAGRIGAVHLQTLEAVQTADTVMVADAVMARATHLASQHDFATPVDLDTIFTTADAVVIASSTDSHAPLLKRAAAAGIPAFCEKPIALDLDTTRSAIAAVESAGITVQMGFQRRYDPAILRIRSAVASGEAGTVYLVRSQTHDPEPPPLSYLPVSGGIFKDCMIHDIDAVRFVTGQEVVAVFATGAALGFPAISDLGDVDSATVILEMSDGTLGQLSALRHDPLGYDVRLEAFGSGASLAAGWSDRTPIESTEPGVPAPSDPVVGWLDRFGAAYRAEMEAFVRVVAGDEAPASTHVDAYEDLRVASACDISLAEGRRVLLEEVA